MTKKEARRMVSRAVASSILADIDNGSGYLFENEDGEPLSDADCNRIRRAAEELADFLRRRVEPKKLRLENRGGP